MAKNSLSNKNIKNGRKSKKSKDYSGGSFFAPKNDENQAKRGSFEKSAFGVKKGHSQISVISH